jgi:hypothetical protein
MDRDSFEGSLLRISTPSLYATCERLEIVDNGHVNRRERAIRRMREVGSSCLERRLSVSVEADTAAAQRRWC